MKVEKTVTVEVCDFCKKSEAWDKCLRCKKSACYECKETRGTEYKHALHFSGSKDGFYCHGCNHLITGDALWLAYNEIANARAEWTRIYKEIEARCKVAEETITRLRSI